MNPTAVPREDLTDEQHTWDIALVHSSRQWLLIGNRLIVRGQVVATFAPKTPVLIEDQDEIEAEDSRNRATG